MYINNPFGDDIAELQEKNAPTRVGQRIREVREDHAPAMSQGDLGTAVGLNANRIQQYENGIRKPKMALLKQIAAALGVETAALADPDTTTYIGMMYALFEMERLFGLQLKEENGKIYLYFQYDGQPGQTLSGVNQVNANLRAWINRQQERDSALEIAASPTEKDKINHEYRLWEWNFPKPLADETEKELKKSESSSRWMNYRKSLMKWKKNNSGFSM